MLALRPLTDPDLPAVLDLFVEAFGADPPPPLAYVEGLVRTEPEGCLGGFDGDRLVAYACSHRAGRIGYLGTLAVREDRRGEGLGRAVTLAATEHLAARCDVVGLAVEPHIGRNLDLYAGCGYEPTLPACCMGRYLPTDRPRALPEGVRDARQLGDGLADALAQVASWSGEVLPGLDLGRDLEFLARAHPTRVLFHVGPAEPGAAPSNLDPSKPGPVAGVIAHHEHLRGDPFWVVRPGPGDARVLDDLLAGLEAATPGDLLQFQFHTAFHRVQPLLRARGYRVTAHKSCLVHRDRRGPWPERSDALFARPWWT